MFLTEFNWLENHVNKLKEAWTLANEKAQERKNALGKSLKGLSHEKKQGTKVVVHIQVH